MRVRLSDPEKAGWATTAVGPWKRHSRRVAYENTWITVYHDDVARPDGSPGIYGVVHFRNLAVGIVALDVDGRVALVGQHRYPLDVMSWEIPEGGSPLGEDALDGAKRELREETGLSASEWLVLGAYHLSNSVSDEEAILYLATALRPGPAEPDATEQLEVRWVHLTEAMAMIDRGEITDAMSVIGLGRVAMAQPSR